jgi:hypothetical protein
VKIVQFLVNGYTRHFTTVNDSDSCYQPTTFYAGECLVRTSREAQLRKERRERTLAASLLRFYPLWGNKQVCTVGATSDDYRFFIPGAKKMLRYEKGVFRTSPSAGKVTFEHSTL